MEPATEPPATYAPVPLTYAPSQPIVPAPNAYGTNSNANGAAGATLSGGAIAGIVLGCLFAVALVAFVVMKKVRDKKREEQMFGEAAELENPDSSADYAAM